MQLASRSIEEISSTVQLSDTGIVPGAGVGNTRSEISKNTLGIPVIAIGIPTVVETAVLVNDCLDVFIQKLQDEAKSNDYLNKLKEEDNYEEIKEALLPKEYNLIVTPKEIDDLIENMKDVVARMNKFCYKLKLRHGGQVKRCIPNVKIKKVKKYCKIRKDNIQSRWI